MQEPDDNDISQSKNGNGSGNNASASNNSNNINCHLNGNSNSSASNDLVNCLENIAQQNQQQQVRVRSLTLTPVDHHSIHIISNCYLYEIVLLDLKWHFCLVRCYPKWSNGHTIKCNN